MATTTASGDLQNPTTRGADDSFAIRIFQWASSLPILVFLGLLVISERADLDGSLPEIALWTSVALGADLMLVRVGKGRHFDYVFARLPRCCPALPSGFRGDCRLRRLL